MGEERKTKERQREKKERDFKCFQYYVSLMKNIGSGNLPILTSHIEYIFPHKALFY